MKKDRYRWYVLVSLFAALALVLGVGCGGSDDDDDTSSPLDVTGAWSLVAVGHPTMTLNLTHAGTNITGTVTESTNYARTVTGTTAAPKGATEPRNVTLVVTFSDGQVATYAGTVNGDNTSMSGSYTTNWGTSDAWSATRI